MNITCCYAAVFVCINCTLDKNGLGCDSRGSSLLFGNMLTMNAALSDVFLANLPKAIRQTYEPIRMKQPNTVFLHMFNWFIEKYGKTTTEDREDNRQRMAADWHPSDGFEPLATRLFVGASYASAARYPMDDRDVIDIGLRVIKRCGMYSEEYKNWIARENESPPIVETIDSFKEYWAAAISLVNQTAIPAANHGYGMNVMDADTSIASGYFCFFTHPPLPAWLNYNRIFWLFGEKKEKIKI